MAAITAADVTVTLNPEDIDRSPDGRIGIRTFPIVQFGDGTTQYVALGVPMPAIGKFGFHFAIKRAYIEQPGNGFIYSFDRTNHKVRIWLGSARAAITMANTTLTGNVAVANHVGVAPTGNVAAPANHVGVAPTGNVAAPANHSHDLVIAANTAANIDANIGANGTKLINDTAAAYTIPGGIAANGGVANAVIAAPAFTGDAPANLSHTAPAFTGDAPANLSHTATLTADAHTHVITGGGAVAEAALAEMDAAVVLAAATHILPMEMVGR